MLDFEIKVPEVKAARKQNGSGKARELFEGGFLRNRDRALFGICYFCGCRIEEALQLKRENIDLKLRGITKGKVQTQQLEIPSTLLQLLE